ncbi:hypothetical protein JZ751_019178 [Albula glossodonta]|uniref:Uncharacterized protein n=1 Tax=Albula glossodonta TaxID=121402 RepID=A0A8T2MSR5_9TELE|nr:hypothetical protein JZ751_019178 [Albula glossodonta]
MMSCVGVAEGGHCIIGFAVLVRRDGAYISPVDFPAIIQQRQAVQTEQEVDMRKRSSGTVGGGGRQQLLLVRGSFRPFVTPCSVCAELRNTRQSLTPGVTLILLDLAYLLRSGEDTRTCVLRSGDKLFTPPSLDLLWKTAVRGELDKDEGNRLLKCIFRSVTSR